MSKKIIVALLSLLGLNAVAQDTPKAKADCEQLLDMLLPFAEQMLEKHGEFFPFGGSMKVSGEMAHVAGYDGREQPPSADIIKLLQDGFRSGARSRTLKATAMVFDVRVVLPSTGNKSDAIAVSLDHRDHYSVVVYFPYQLQNGNVVYGETFAEKGTAEIFK